jgi:hypothetical protein
MLNVIMLSVVALVSAEYTNINNKTNSNYIFRKTFLNQKHKNKKKLFPLFTNANHCAPLTESLEK